jgi:hypothetical protein
MILPSSAFCLLYIHHVVYTIVPRDSGSLRKGPVVATIVSAGKSQRPMIEILAEKEESALRDSILDARIKAIKDRIAKMAQQKGK